MNRAKGNLIFSMFLFGTIGIFVRNIPLPSSVIALSRGLVGMLFLILVTFIKKEKLSALAIKENLVILCLSGTAIGANWILLFESYRYTTVAVSTLCYYLAPIFVIIVSPVFLKEKITIRKVICIFVALMGMVLVSGVYKSNVSISDMKGILFGIGAASLYAAIMLLNKRLRNISAYERTIVQLGITALVVCPYILLTENVSALPITYTAFVLLIVVGVVHTGIGYTLYFGSMSSLPVQTVALLSYIDPVVAILISMFILKEGMSVAGIAGAVLVLGATLFSEVLPNQKEE